MSVESKFFICGCVMGVLIADLVCHYVARTRFGEPATLWRNLMFGSGFYMLWRVHRRKETS